MKSKSYLMIGAMALSLLATPFATMSTASATTTPTLAVIDGTLQNALTNTIGLHQVIVTFKGDGAPTAEQVNLLKSVGITKGVTLRALPIAGVLATADQVKKLSADPSVQSLYLNEKLSYDNQSSTSVTGVDQVRADATMTTQNGGLPVNGQGIGVLVNDSGVDGTHPDLQFGANLKQNVAGQLNLNSVSTLLPVTYVENIPNTDTTGGHGTHVAGTVGGTGAASGGKYEGVAPGASLIGFGSGAALFMLDTLGGFDYALTNKEKYGIRVVTNSWGNTGDVGTDFDPNDPTNIATKKLYDRGVVVVFSAGNSGPAESTITGNFKKAPWVVTVAAGDKNRNLADFSSRGVNGKGGSFTLDGRSYTWADRPTVTAPGVDIISTRVIAPVSSLGAQKDLATIDPLHLPFYTTMSGTSMATPHVAGIIALMLDANPDLTPDQVKQILQETATSMTARATWEVGAGYANAYKAVEQSFLTPAFYGRTVN